MAAIPARNAAATLATGEHADELRVTVPTRHAPLLRILAGPLGLRPTRTFALDPLGAELLHQIDGETTVGAMVDRFGAQHRLTHFEARGLVAHYLGELLSRGIIVIAVPRSALHPPQ